MKFVFIAFGIVWISGAHVNGALEGRANVLGGGLGSLTDSLCLAELEVPFATYTYTYP